MKRRNRLYRTGFLFSTPKFLVGAGSVLNIAGNYYRYNSSASTLEADAKALRNDWGVVGQDLLSAMKSLKL